MFKKLKKRRGSIAMVLVFGTSIAVLSVGMLRVAVAMNASSRTMQKQYAELQNMSAICDVSCYEFITDVMAASAVVRLDHVMPGMPSFSVYQEGLSAIQTEFAPYVDGASTWVVDDVTRAIFTVGNANEEIQAMLLSLVTGREQSFKLEVVSPFDPNYDSEDVYIGIDEVRVPLEPIQIRVTLKVKSNIVTEYYSVEGLCMRVRLGTSIDEHGNEFDSATVCIAEDTNGNGVQIYRGEHE